MQRKSEKMGVKIEGPIEKINGREISYIEFAERYLAKNQPVVVTGLMDDWRACSDWVSSNGQPNLNFFSNHFGKSKVQVADCGTRDLTDQKRKEMSVSEFVNHWLQGSVEELDGDDKSLLYLKDWHFFKEYPAYPAYRTPLFFIDDWLNLYLDHYQMHDDPETYQENNDICCSDYRFVYMGAKGTWTPLHADVFRSFSWSANVCGKKKWLFLPPLQCHLLFDRNMRSSVYNIFDDVSETKFPGFKKAIWLECVQEQNEIIFVPSGWFHQVHNLEDTISINHNWFNGYNLSWVWDLLLRDYKEAKEYIEDIKDICDDFEGLCQRNLAANTGMNFNDFFIFISRFSLANVVELYLFHSESKWESSICHWSATVQHFALNLASIRKIALKMKFEDGMQGNLKILDLRKSLSDPKFLNLCTGLGKMYAVIHEQDSWNRTAKKDLIADLEKYGSQICSPEDLVKFIEYAISEFSGKYAEQNPLLSGLSDMQSHNEK